MFLGLVQYIVILQIAMLHIIIETVAYKIVHFISVNYEPFHIIEFLMTSIILNYLTFAMHPLSRLLSRALSASQARLLAYSISTHSVILIISILHYSYVRFFYLCLPVLSHFLYQIFA